MSKTLQYNLQVEVSDGTDVDELEELLQALLLDLYEQGGVESITVTKDGYIKTNDDDLGQLLDTIESLDSEHIKRAIDTVKELEES